MFENNYRTIKPSGLSDELSFSPIGLGTVKFGRNTDVKYAHAFELPSDAAICALLARAKSLNINLIDTAPAYGESEKRIGQLLSQREHWVISTKVGERYHAGQSVFDFTQAAIEQSILQSLKRLNTTWLDIVLIHSDGNDFDILAHTDAVNTLQRFKRKGIIRAIGISSKTAEGGIAALKHYDMDIAMITHHLHYRAEQPVIDYAMAHHKQIFIKKAFASGHLIQPVAQAASQTASQAASQPDNPTDTLQATMDFLLASPVNTVICGTINPEHLSANCRAAENSLQAIAQCATRYSNTGALRKK
ncbi:aldo/keto reductase [Ostreibacterium oceani]|uniref:Aldo/keto reductase n=1 Tax=Ostreibacterium oceani TaxID=2654998 RepID=A0A6N7EXY6_9GAMM|nr:aldo/keto reductase [Ostreibacterium oceani]MPV85987.1 aldo/keto reductase [Ostreibacterium oceani]